MLNAADRLGLVDLGRAGVVVSADNVETGGEVRGAVANIRSEREEAGSHYERETVQRTPTLATSWATGGRTLRTATVTDMISAS